jgi:hypothetical protein
VQFREKSRQRLIEYEQSSATQLENCDACNQVHKAPDFDLVEKGAFLLRGVPRRGELCADILYRPTHVHDALYSAGQTVTVKRPSQCVLEGFVRKLVLLYGHVNARSDETPFRLRTAIASQTRERRSSIDGHSINS